MKNRSCQNGSGHHCNYKYLRKKHKRNTKPTEQKAETTKYTKTAKRNTKPTKVWNISIHERKSLKKTIIFSAEPFSTESFPIPLGLKKVLKGFMKTFRSFMS